MSSVGLQDRSKSLPPIRTVRAEDTLNKPQPKMIPQPQRRTDQLASTSDEKICIDGVLMSKYEAEMELQALQVRLRHQHARCDRLQGLLMGVSPPLLQSVQRNNQAGEGSESISLSPHRHTALGSMAGSR